MALTTGQSLSFYEILGPLGAGGMGEVYLAKDTRLEREVAIKVLPEELADDDERLRRFEREAKTLASLNHPNVAGIHGIDQVQDTCFLAMELVPGEDLEERLRRGKLPMDEALDVCRQLAEGLEAAHEAGVVHRDLKPANVRITPEGIVKILDFGLAKPIGPNARKSGTTSAQSDSFLVTSEGMILGTPTYMSPEQARGKPVDRRTDIWAFGCVLFECLTGNRAFEGDAFGDLIAAILEHEVDLGALPSATPPHVRHLIRRCLIKDPRERLRDVGEARLALAGRAELMAESDTRRPTSALPWLLAVVASALAVFLAWRSAGQDSAPESASAHAEPRRFEAKTFGKQLVYNARFLPDGKSIAYSAALSGSRPELFLLQPGANAPQSVAPLGTHLLSVSSSGELAVLTDTRYLFHRVHEGTLGRMRIDGSPRALVESVRDADWGPDGELAIVRRVGALVRLEYPIDNVLYETAGYVSEPRVSADGSRVAFLDHPDEGDDRGWVKLVDGQGRVETLTPQYQAIEGLTWAPDESRLYFSSADATVVQVQVRSTGLATGDVRLELTAPGELVVVDIGADGRMAILSEELFWGIAALPPGGAEEVDLTWLDGSWGCKFGTDKESVLFTTHRGGSTNYYILSRRLDGSPVTSLGEGYGHGVSPDGVWVAGQLHDPPAIVLHPMGVGMSRRLERGPIEHYRDATWFPDGQHLFFTANEAGRPTRCFRQSIDGGLPEPVTPEGIFGALSPLGDRILVRAQDGWKLYPLDGGPPELAKGLTDNDVPFWSEDSKSVHVHDKLAETPLRLERVDLGTGERVPSLVVGPAREAGLVSLNLSQPIPGPGGGYCYSYIRRLSQLLVVDGDS